MFGKCPRRITVLACAETNGALHAIALRETIKVSLFITFPLLAQGKCDRGTGKIQLLGTSRHLFLPGRISRRSTSNRSENRVWSKHQRHIVDLRWKDIRDIRQSFPGEL